MNLEPRAAIHQAVCYLADQCDKATTEDGVGFNKFDADWGHSIAQSDPETWTPRTARALWMMLRKYRKQLKRGGIEYGDIPEPEIPRPSVSSAPLKCISFENELFLISFPYEPRLVSLVKELNGRRWHQGRKLWTLPETSAAAIVVFAADNDFSITPEAQAIIEKELDRTSENLVASKATSGAEEYIPGLRPFQRAGVSYALRNKCTFIADEMGLGKTVQALATIEAANAYPAFVVCPASLKLNWLREAGRWLPNRRAAVLEDHLWKMPPSILSQADILIANYDSLIQSSVPGSTRKEPRFFPRVENVRSLLEQANRALQAVILDESHFVKSRDAQRSQACRQLASKILYRLLLTGTPILNRPSELIHQLQVMGRLEAMGGFWGFVNRYCGAQRTRYGLDLTGATNLEELNAKLRATCMVRREKSEVLKELPPKQRNRVPLEIVNRAEYDYAAEDLIEFLSEQDPDKADAATRAQQLVKIETLKQLAAKGKLEGVLEWVEDFLECGQKLVLFAHHKDVQRAIASHFPGCATLYGEHTSEERQSAVDTFQQDDSCRLIVCSLQAGGVGITLTAASNVAFVELGWNPATHDQAEDRCHRIGQSDQVMAWYLLAANTIDEEIEDLIEKKRSVITAATDGQSVDPSVFNDLLARLRSKIKAHGKENR